jgi:sigma-B regulation protein RsbU (phosphoserine phosphatase)
MRPGQLCLLGTDGIWEARNEQGEFFGKDRLQAILRENAQLDAKMIATAVIDAVEDFREEAGRSDDVTCVVVKFC